VGEGEASFSGIIEDYIFQEEERSNEGGGGGEGNTTKRIDTGKPLHLGKWREVFHEVSKKRRRMHD